MENLLCCILLRGGRGGIHKVKMHIRRKEWLNLKGTTIALMTSSFCYNVNKGKG